MVSNKFKLFILSILAFILSGCATPGMQLTHTNSINDHYANMGTIEIARFQDQRPDIQTRNDGSWSKYNNNKIYTGKTYPDLIGFLQQVLTKEAQQSGLFTVTQQPEYRLTGYLKSLAIIQNTYSTPEVPAYSAIIKYQANLEKDGIVIFSKTVEVYFNMYQWALKNVDDVHMTYETPQAALDMAITQSAKSLFSNMQQALSDKATQTAEMDIEGINNPNVTPLPLPDVATPIS